MSCTAVKARKHAGKWPRKNLKRNGSRGKCGFGSRHVSYCPECKSSDAGHPESAPKVNAELGNRQARCPQGHVWMTSGKATGIR